MGRDYNYLLEDAQREYARRYKVLKAELCKLLKLEREYPAVPGPGSDVGPSDEVVHAAVTKLMQDKSHESNP